MVRQSTTTQHLKISRKKETKRRRKEGKDHNHMDTSQDGSAESVLTNLRTYISEIGGQIHQDIEIRAISDDNRGVFARNAIAKGNLLISLPIAISGKDFPTTYKDGKKQVSPWLRCLAAFWEAPIPYLESLPSFFETLSE